MPSKIIKCKSCKGSGSLKSYEHKPFPCPYCKGTGKRTIKVVDPSHRMSKWGSEIITPCGTPRFYAVRHCTKCGEEEWEHAAGHFFHRLLEPCKGK